MANSHTPKTQAPQGAAPDSREADCARCFKEAGGVIRDRMILCPTCGNKRCPKATDHRLACTGSNEPGQEGSAYATPKPEGETVALLRGMRPYAERIMKYSQAGCRALDEMMRDMESVSDNARALLARIDAALTTKEQP